MTYIYCPPFMESTVPVIQSASDEARYTAALPTYAGCADPAQRDERKNLGLHDLFRNSSHHVSRYESRGDGIYGYAFFRIFPCRVLVNPIRPDFADA